MAGPASVGNESDNNHDAVGAKSHLRIWRLIFSVDSIQSLAAEVTLSAHDPRYGSWNRKENVQLILLKFEWPQPSGKKERFTNLPIDRYITIVEGTGKWK